MGGQNKNHKTEEFQFHTVLGLGKLPHSKQFF